MYKKTLICLAMLTTSITAAASTSGDMWRERELLERYISQVEALDKGLLAQAELSADLSRRVHLDYSLLRKDIHESLEKIRAYLGNPNEPHVRLPNE